MSHNSKHLYAIRKRDEQLVFIDDVLNGKKCNCICSKCKDPLVAKNGGKIYVHHFAHSADTECTGESLAHLKAKEIIKMKKYLWLPTLNEDKKVEFDNVDDEALIGDSNFRVDLICKADNKSIIVEIVVTHDIDSFKSIYLKSHKVNTLIIDLSRELENDEYNKLPDDFSDIVLKTAHRYWFYNEKVDKNRKDRAKRWRKKQESLQRKNNAAFEKQIKLEKEKGKKEGRIVKEWNQELEKQIKLEKEKRKEEEFNVYLKELKKIRKEEYRNGLQNFKKENTERINELIEVSKNNPGYTENLVDDFINKNYGYGKDIKIIERINGLINNGGLYGE